MLSNCDIICMSSLDWHFSWHPNQEIMYRFGEAGNRVLYVETTGIRNARLRDWRRIVARLRTSLGTSPVLQKTHPNVTVYAPLVLPFPHSQLAHHVNKKIVFRRIDAWRSEGPEENLIVWAYLPSPMTMAVIDHLSPPLVVFHYMVDAKASRPLPAVAKAEVQLLRRSDLVFANSLPLLENAKCYTHRAYLFRAGVDVEAFRARARGAPRPPELEGLQGPIAGYAGSIHEWLDVDLLIEAACRLPSWHFVMIGTHLRDISPTRRFANIHWLGPRPHQVLPQYINHFDVCMIPYVLDTYTASAYPGKLNEYLALGKPVVATLLPELVSYNREFGNVVYLAATRDEFVLGLIRALQEDSQLRDQYLAAATANSWRMQLEAMSALMIETIRSHSAVASV